MMLLDTCIVIDYFRKKLEAVRFIRDIPSAPCISVLTVAELYGGFKGESELDELERFVESVKTVEVSENIAKSGGRYRNQYHASHGTGFIDAMLAATAKEYGYELITRNLRHFPMFPQLQAPY